MLSLHCVVLKETYYSSGIQFWFSQSILYKLYKTQNNRHSENGKHFYSKRFDFNIYAFLECLLFCVLLK